MKLVSLRLILWVCVAFRLSSQVEQFPRTFHVAHCNYELITRSRGVVQASHVGAPAAFPYFLSLLLPFHRLPCLSLLFPWSVWYQCHRKFPSRNCKVPAQCQNFRKFPFLKHSETSHKRTFKSVNKLTQSRGVAHVGARTLFLFSSYPSLLFPFPSPPLSCFPFQVAHCNYKLVRRGWTSPSTTRAVGLYRVAQKSKPLSLIIIKSY